MGRSRTSTATSAHLLQVREPPARRCFQAPGSLQRTAAVRRGRTRHKGRGPGAWAKCHSRRRATQERPRGHTFVRQSRAGRGPGGGRTGSPSQRGDALDFHAVQDRGLQRVRRRSALQRAHRARETGRRGRAHGNTTFDNVFVPPYNHLDTFLGQGTIGLEVQEQVPALLKSSSPTNGTGTTTDATSTTADHQRCMPSSLPAEAAGCSAASP